MMKTCNKCNVEKPLTDFTFDNSKGRYTPACKQCRAAALKTKRDADRDEYNAKTKEWINRTKERQLANRLEWKRANKDKVNALARRRWGIMTEDRIFEHFMSQMEE